MNNFALLDFSTTELFIILAIVLLLFGSKKLPELSRSIGESLKELKGAASDVGEMHKDVKTQAVDIKNSLKSDVK